MSGAETLGLVLVVVALVTMVCTSMAPPHLLTRRQWGWLMLGGGGVGALAALLMVLAPA